MTTWQVSTAAYLQEAAWTASGHCVCSCHSCQAGLSLEQAVPCRAFPRVCAKATCNLRLQPPGGFWSSQLIVVTPPCQLLTFREGNCRLSLSCLGIVVQGFPQLTPTLAATCPVAALMGYTCRPCPSMDSC